MLVDETIVVLHTLDLFTRTCMRSYPVWLKDYYLVEPSSFPILCVSEPLLTSMFSTIPMLAVLDDF